MAKTFNANPDVLDEIREQLNGTFAEILASHNIEIKLGRIGYTGSNATAKITMNLIEEGKEAYESRVEWDNLYQIDYTLLGAEMSINGKRFRIIGWNKKAKKNPLVLKNLKTGEEGYSCPYENLIRAHHDGELIRPLADDAVAIEKIGGREGSIKIEKKWRNTFYLSESGHSIPFDYLKHDTKQEALQAWSEYRRGV